MNFQPRLIRLKDASAYLGMDKNRFNAEVRPYLTEIPIGKQGVGFDRIDLDEWFEEYKARNGRPGKTKGGTLWGRKSHQDSLSVERPGMSPKPLTDSALDKALDRILLKKPNGS